MGSPETVVVTCTPPACAAVSARASAVVERARAFGGDERGDARQRHPIREHRLDGPAKVRGLLTRAGDEVDLHGAAGAYGVVVAGRDDQRRLQLAAFDGPY